MSAMIICTVQKGWTLNILMRTANPLNLLFAEKEGKHAMQRASIYQSTQLVEM